MSIAKTLPPVDPFFNQQCPLCGTHQRMMIRGLYIDKKDGKGSLYPDMGYSFCNCRDIFFTKWENITSDKGGFNSLKDPIGKLKEMFCEFMVGQEFIIIMKDPYFCHWNHPHDYAGFNPRENYILWDAESFIKECKKVGFEVIKWKREMDVNAEIKECYHVTLRKP